MSQLLMTITKDLQEKVELDSAIISLSDDKNINSRSDFIKLTGWTRWEVAGYFAGKISSISVEELKRVKKLLEDL